MRNTCLKSKNKRTVSAMLLLLLGWLCLLHGIHRGEHLTVEQKSGLVCLECIGIG